MLDSMDSFPTQLSAQNAFPFPDMSSLPSFDMSSHAQHQTHNFICPQDMSRPDGHTVSSGVSNVTSPSPTGLGISDAHVSSPQPPKKKRKSWGQVLPKPTTNLPPRKRAKTEEEKAQRKYERVQRNRHAAHMSRMRKQDEMENLKRENGILKQENASLNLEVNRLQEEVNSLRSGTLSREITPQSASDPFGDIPSLVPSLEASPSAPSCEPEGISTPPPFSGAIFPFEVEDLKHSDASHSAAMCSQPWTPGFQDFLPIKQESLVL